MHSAHEPNVGERLCNVFVDFAMEEDTFICNGGAYISHRSEYNSLK